MERPLLHCGRFTSAPLKKKGEKHITILWAFCLDPFIIYYNTTKGLFSCKCNATNANMLQHCCREHKHLLDVLTLK